MEIQILLFIFLLTFLIKNDVNAGKFGFSGSSSIGRAPTSFGRAPTSFGSSSISTRYRNPALSGAGRSPASINSAPSTSYGHEGSGAGRPSASINSAPSTPYGYKQSGAGRPPLDSINSAPSTSYGHEGSGAGRPPPTNSANQPHSTYNPSQTIGHPSHPAHIPSPVPSTFGNRYSTHPVGGTYSPAGHSYYPQQHVLAQPASQPYIPGQTVIMVPDQQDNGRGFGQMVKEALVFSTINAGVNRLINSHHDHYTSDYGRPVSSTSETHTTYNNYYFNTTSGNTSSVPVSANVPQGQGNVPLTNAANYSSLNNSAITPSVSSLMIVGNNSSVTYPVSNDASMNAVRMTNNMGGPPVAPSAEISTGNTVNNKNSPDEGTIVYSPQHMISDNELMMLTEELFAKQEVNISKYLTLDIQNKSENVTDEAKRPLIYAQQEVYDYPTIQVIRALYDNYEHNSTVKETRTYEKRKKEDLLLAMFLNTNVMTRAMQWLSDRDFIDPDDFEKKDTLRHIWFNQFDGATSGFERVFTSERYGADLLGVQDWIYFDYQESKRRIEYLGYVDILKLGNRGSLLKLNFKMDDVIRPNATIFVGTLPELEMSLYTICFYARTNNLCPVSLGGAKFNIFTHSFRYYGKDLIDLALPIF